MKSIFFVFSAVFGVTISLNAHADLAGLGPVDSANGFPAYYQDFGIPNLSSPIAPLALGLCLPSQEELANNSCLLEPGDIPEPSKPIKYPSNFPLESFYYSASTKTPVTGVAGAGGKADLRMDLEASISPDSSNGEISPRVFSRLRYKFLPPVSGNYVIETPYSTDGPIHYSASNDKEVKVTIDIGFNCANGDFSCALKGLTAPFLRASDVEGGAPAPFYQAHGNSYLAPPHTEVFVTGGSKGNKFKITVIPDGQTTPITIVNTNQFQLMGRIYQGSAPMPASVPPIPPAPPTPTIPDTPPPSPVPTVDKPSVSISAADPLASEASGDTGKFMINLDAPSAKDITIKYKLAGKAKNGKDYKKLASHLMIPAGTVVGAIDVVPFNDVKHEGTEKVTLTLIKKGVKDCILRGKLSASIAIFDND